MRALIVCESMFGNTKAIAEAVADGLATHTHVDIVEVGDAPAMLPDDVGLLVLGGPTHAFGMSRPASRDDARKRADAGGVVSSRRGIREWLDEVGDGDGRSAVAFDTRVTKRWAPGSASGPALKRLARRGFDTGEGRSSFYVEDVLGPLSDGELERAKLWGGHLGLRVGADPRMPRRS